MGDIEIFKFIFSSGATGLVFWIVYRELPAFRKSLSEAIAAFREELKAEREQAAKDRAEDTRARHAQAESGQVLALSVQHLADTIGVELPRKPVAAAAPEIQLAPLPAVPPRN